MSLCLTEQLSDAYRIKIAVVPIGNIPPSKFQYYLHILQKCHTLPLANMSFGLASSSHHSDYTAAFPRVSWHSGSIKLSFECPFDANTHVNVENSPNWGVCFHKKYLGVVGVVDCASDPDLDAAFASFQLLPDHIQFRTALKFRCFAFEPLENQADLPERQNLIMFPNTGNDTSRLLFYTETILNDFISFLVLDLALLVLNKDLQPTPQTALDCILDLESPLPSNSTQDILPKNSEPKESPNSSRSISEYLSPKSKSFSSKSRAGRLLKMNADIALLAGSPEDAQFLYESAIDSFGNKDVLWSGCCYQGLGVCQYINSDINISDEMSSENNEAEEEYSKIELLLQKGIDLLDQSRETVYMQIENLFILSRFLFGISNSKVKGMKALMLSFQKCAYLNSQDQILFCLQASFLCQSLNLYRKSSLFTREASLILSQMCQPQQAHSLLQQVLVQYKADTHTTQWLGIQKCLLEECLFNALQMDNPFLICSHICSLLRLLFPYIRKESQISLFTQLKAHAPSYPLSCSIDLSLIPKISSFSLFLSSAYNDFQNETELCPRKETNGAKDVFIFSPNTSSKQKTSAGNSANNPKVQVIALRDTIEFELVLENLFEVPLDISPVQISSVPISSFSSLSVLPVTTIAPKSKTSITICTRPLTEGNILIEGITLSVLGLSFMHTLPHTISLNVVKFPALATISVSSEKKSLSKLFNGRLLSSECVLTNIGTCPISSISLTVKEHALSRSEGGQDQYYNDSDTDTDASIHEFAHKLPLAVGQSITIPFSLTAKDWHQGISIVGKYSEECEEYYRQCSVYIPMEVKHTPQITAMKLFSMDSYSETALVVTLDNKSDIVYFVEFENFTNSHTEKVIRELPPLSSQRMVFCVSKGKDYNSEDMLSFFLQSFSISWSLPTIPPLSSSIPIPSDIASSLCLSLFTPPIAYISTTPLLPVFTIHSVSTLLLSVVVGIPNPITSPINIQLESSTITILGPKELSVALPIDSDTSDTKDIPVLLLCKHTGIHSLLVHVLHNNVLEYTKCISVEFTQ